MNTTKLVLAALVGLTLSAACAVEVRQDAESNVSDDVEGRAVPLVAIPNARVPIDGVLSGGQPTPEQIAAAAAGGVRTVINLRTDAEEGFAWEREAVERAGMRYVQLPVDGADGLTRDTVDALDRLLDEARADGPVLLHCGSGNRIGALLALRAAWLEGLPADEALRYGNASGLTRLEPATRERLGLPAHDAAR